MKFSTFLNIFMTALLKFISNYSNIWITCCCFHHQFYSFFFFNHLALFLGMPVDFSLNARYCVSKTNETIWGSSWCYHTSERVYFCFVFWQAVSLGKDHCNPLWLKLVQSWVSDFCEGYPISSLLLFLGWDQAQTGSLGCLPGFLLLSKFWTPIFVSPAPQTLPALPPRL